MSDAPAHPARLPTWQLEPFLQGRALGLIAADQPPRSDRHRDALAPALASQAARGLGSIRLVAHRGADDDASANRIVTETSLLLLGPMDDDHGRVMGALRAHSARSDQAIAMHRAFGADHIVEIRLRDRGNAGKAADLWADRFEPHKLGLYCALLHGKPFDPRSVLQAYTVPSFFSRQWTTRQIAAPSQAVPGES